MPGDFQREEKSAFPVAFGIGIVVVLLLVGGVILATRFTRSKAPAVQPLPFGATEQAAAARIHFTDLQMARASNYLNQEVTYVAGTISNDGVATIREVEVAFEFHDPFDQVILRESRRLLGPGAKPLAGGQRADFQVSLDYVPAEWNHQYPTIRILGVALVGEGALALPPFGPVFCRADECQLIG
jgi:hypothetical protein